MDPNTAFDLVRTLGSLASMISAYVAIRRERRELDDKTREEIFSAQYVKDDIFLSKGIESARALPKDIGDASRDRIKRVLDRYAKAISSPLNPFELDKETEVAEFEICHILRLIKKHNKGVLPSEFRKLWDAFNCDQKEH